MKREVIVCSKRNVLCSAWLKVMRTLLPTEVALTSCGADLAERLQVSEDSLVLIVFGSGEDEVALMSTLNLWRRRCPKSAANVMDVVSCDVSLVLSRVKEMVVYDCNL